MNTRAGECNFNLSWAYPKAYDHLQECSHRIEMERSSSFWLLTESIQQWLNKLQDILRLQQRVCKVPEKNKLSARKEQDAALNGSAQVTHF